MFSTNSRSTLKQSSIIFYSNVVSFFDFLLYLYLAQIISETFFSANPNSFMGELQTMSLFAAGYLARPVGGLLLGRYGDIKGRRSTYLVSASILLVTSIVTACLPTYAQVGILAPALFILARLIQGVAFGAHSVLGWVFIAEHSPKDKVAFFTNIASAGHMVGVIFTLFFFKMIFNVYTHDQLVVYAWRVPFLVSAGLGLISLLLSFKLQETPVFLSDPSRQNYFPKYKDISLNVGQFHAIFISLLLSFYVSSLVIVVALMLPKLILMKFYVDESLLSFANILGTFFIALGTLFFGAMSDKGNIGKTLMIGSIAVSVFATALYTHLQYGSGDYLLPLYALLGFSTGIIGLGPVIMVQLFPTKVRLTGVSVTYNTTYALVGGTLPIGLMYFTEIIGFSPSLYLTFLGLIGFTLGLYMSQMPKLKPMTAKPDSY